MSTRSVTTFKDTYGSTFHVYKHHDGYPTGMQELFARLLESGKVWGLPRFEADEFAAGFVAVAKVDQGGVRLQTSRTQACDVAYGYTIYQRKGQQMPRIKVSSPEFWDGGRKETTLWDGPLSSFTPEVAAKLEE
jgi:hypothetical protein